MKRAWMLTLLLGAGSCAQKDEWAPPMEAAERVATPTAMPGAPPPPPSPEPASRRGGREKKKVDRAITGEAQARDGEVAPEEATRRERMVHYNGHLRLKVPTSAHTLQQATEIADAAGGYVEALTSSAVTLRVPVARFREVYDELSQLGDVLSRSLSAHDVTDAFVATELRVKTLKASRGRLIALLAKATKSREKLELLRQINRLTEQIDQLEMQLDTIAALASFSRITLEVVPHQVHVGSADDEPVAAFRWIHHLSPFSRDIAQAGERLELEVPEGMVELSATDTWIAESADGAVIWTSKRANEPEGTTDFWLDAIKTRLEAAYGKGEVFEAGGFALLELVDRGAAGYRYVVGVRVVDDELSLVEVYYPSAEHAQRYDDVVRAVIAGGEK